MTLVRRLVGDQYEQERLIGLAACKAQKASGAALEGRILACQAADKAFMRLAGECLGRRTEGSTCGRELVTGDGAIFTALADQFFRVDTEPPRQCIIGELDLPRVIERQQRRFRLLERA